MVGYIPEPASKEEVEHDQASKPQTLKDSLESFDPKLVDLSFADSLVDFDSIKEFFEVSPDKIGLENKVGFGRFEKVMEVEGDKGTPLQDPVVVGHSGSEVVEKVEKVEKEGGGLEGGGNLGCCSIEEEMGRVNLNCESNLVDGSVGPEGSNAKSEVVGGEAEMSNHCLVDGSSSDVGNGTGLSGELKRDGDGSESDLESETESSSISSSSSSSSSSSNDEDDSKESDQEEENVVRVVEKERSDDGEIEEGEIRDDAVEELFSGAGTEHEDVGKMVGWSDVDEDEDEDGMAGSIQSKNEQVLPPVPPVDVTLQAHHQMESVGVVSSVIGSQVIVEGVEKHNPLSEGSVLWITDRRSPLGLIDEIFGPVKNPYYIVRYNSDSDVPAGIHEGTFVSFVPEFANHVLNEKALYEKGYDASDKEDNELLDEVEFSDDEKEAEYKRMQKMLKRGVNEQIVGNNKKDRKKVKNRDRNLKNGKPFGPRTPVGQLPVDQDQPDVYSLGSSVSHGSSSSSATRQDFIGGTGFIPPFAQMGQTAGTFPPSNGVWVNGIPSQPSQSAMFPGGFQISNIDGNSKTAGPSGPQTLVTGGSSFSPAPGQCFTGGTGFVPPFPQIGQTTGVFQPSSGLWANGVPSQQPQSARTPGGFKVNDMPWPALNQLQQPSLLALLNAIQLQQQFNASQGLHPNSILPGGQPNPFAGLPYPAWQGVAGQNCFNQTTFEIGCQGQPTHPTMNSLNAGDQGMMPNAQGQQNPISQQPAAIPGHFQAAQDQFNAGSFSGRGRKPRCRGGGRNAGGRGRHK